MIWSRKWLYEGGHDPCSLNFKKIKLMTKFDPSWTTWTDLRLFSGAVQLYCSSSGLIDDITQCSEEPVSWLFFYQLASKN